MYLTKYIFVQGGTFNSITPGDLDFNRGTFEYVKQNANQDELPL
jgi:hypothetical protein